MKEKWHEARGGEVVRVVRVARVEQEVARVELEVARVELEVARVELEVIRGIN